MTATMGPYFDELSQPILRDSVIVVVDILGYSQAIQERSRVGDLQHLLEFVYLALSDSFRDVRDPSGAKWFPRMMTDNLIVAYPILNDFPIPNNFGGYEFMQACFNIGRYQLTMIKYGLPIRGGISVGKIHISETLTLPDSAVLAETERAEDVASSPRVVLLESGKKFLTEHEGQFGDAEHMLNMLLEADEDGMRFVNYLRPLARPISTERADMIVAHKQFIEGGLAAFSRCERILAKYKWMAKYHNRFCRSVPEFDCAEALISS